MGSSQPTPAALAVAPLRCQMPWWRQMRARGVGALGLAPSFPLLKRPFRITIVRSDALRSSFAARVAPATHTFSAFPAFFVPENPITHHYTYCTSTVQLTELFTTYSTVCMHTVFIYGHKARAAGKTPNAFLVHVFVFLLN